MKKCFWSLCFFHPVLLWAQAVNVSDTRLLTLPAVSKEHITFVYAKDLWVANPEGKEVRRLTTGQVVESPPAFSPDGK